MNYEALYHLICMLDLCEGLQWLSPEMTVRGELPCASQAHARSAIRFWLCVTAALSAYALN